jgi:hypothetical protein
MLCSVRTPSSITLRCAWLVTVTLLSGCYTSTPLGSAGLLSADWTPRNFTVVAERVELTDCYSYPVDYGAAVRSIIEKHPPANALIHAQVEYKVQWVFLPPVFWGPRECSRVAGDAVVLR